MTFSTANQKYEKVKERYRADKAKGVDVPLVEYLHFSDLIKVIRIRGRFDDLGYQNGRKYKKELGALVSLRDIVAHPTRSLITDLESCKKLWQRIDLVESVLFHLRWHVRSVLTSYR